MAKNSFKTSFSKATITKEDNIYVITEYTKDEIKGYNLSDVLDELVGVDGITLAISKDTEIEPID